jgi:hypothetical protein
MLTAGVARASWWDVLAAASQPSGAAEWTPPSGCVIRYDDFTQAQLDSGLIPDKSGNNIYLWQTNSAKRGSIVDGNCIQGNGSSSFWMFTNATVSITNFTAMTICTPASAGNKMHIFLIDQPSGANDIFRLGSYRSAGTALPDTVRVYHDGSLVYESAAPIYYDAAITNAYNLTALVFGQNNAYNLFIPNNSSAAVTGAVDTACAYSITNIAGNSGTLSTFLSYAQTYFSDSKVKAFLMFDRKLDTSEIQGIKEHYLP